MRLLARDAGRDSFSPQRRVMRRDTVPTKGLWRLWLPRCWLKRGDRESKKGEKTRHASARLISQTKIVGETNGRVREIERERGATHARSAEERRVKG